MWELIWPPALMLVVMLVLVPLIGGALLWLVFKLAKITEFSFLTCWKAYLTSCCCAYLLLTGLRFVWLEGSELLVVRVVIFVAMTVGVVPLILRGTSRRIWLVVGIAVPVIDALVLGLAMGLFEAVKREEGPRRLAPPAGPTEMTTAREKATREPSKTSTSPGK